MLSTKEELLLYCFMAIAGINLIDTKQEPFYLWFNGMILCILGIVWIVMEGLDLIKDMGWGIK